MMSFRILLNLKTKSEAKMRDGVRLGITDRTEQVTLGTQQGVVKCRAIRRRPEGPAVVQ